MTADRGPRYVFSDEQCPERGPSLAHHTNGSINCVYCGAWVIHRKVETTRQARMAEPFTHELEEPPWLQTLELTIHEHDPEAMLIHPISSLWIAHNHTIPEQQTIEIKNIIGRHVERFHMRGYVAPLPNRDDLG